jgi:hypothetical protein
MSDLSKYEHILSLVGHDSHATIISSKGRKYSAIVIILEYAHNGDLFDIVKSK